MIDLPPEYAGQHEARIEAHRQRVEAEEAAAAERERQAMANAPPPASRKAAEARKNAAKGLARQRQWQGWKMTR